MVTAEERSVIMAMGGTLVGFFVVTELQIVMLAGLWNWFGDAANATGIQALAALSQVGLTAALILLTWKTVQANATMAEANNKMARYAAEERESATRPILAFALGPSNENPGPAPLNNFIVEVSNIGLGPALDVTIRVRNGPLKYIAGPYPVQPLAIGAGDSIGIEFTLDYNFPFLDATNPLKWGAKRGERIVDQVMQETEQTRYTDFQIMNRYARAERLKSELERRLRKRSITYVQTLPDAGQVVADFKDINGNNHGTRATLLITPRRRGWPVLHLGPLLILVARLTGESRLTATVE